MNSSSRFRVREIGIRPGTLEPGPLNAITDIPGVLVGQVTLREDSAAINPGFGTVCTGVTVILPHGGDPYLEKVVAAVHTINGFGKATGFEQIRELGVLETPIALTNTLNVGRVWDSLVSWAIQKTQPIDRIESLNPLVGECNDAFLNDIQRRFVSEEHVFEALEKASSGPVEEGAVGAGTGMSCYEFKGGVGTSSRVIGDYRVGGLVVTNFGSRAQLTITGVPVGRELGQWMAEPQRVDGSVMIVLATDAPLSDRQLGRLARRAGMGLARTGSTIGHSSGDFVVAFSTANRVMNQSEGDRRMIEVLNDSDLNIYFQAVVETVEEAVLNSMFKAVTVEGYLGHISPALPLDQVIQIMHNNGHQEINFPPDQQNRLLSQ